MCRKWRVGILEMEGGVPEPEKGRGKGWTSMSPRLTTYSGDGWRPGQQASNVTNLLQTDLTQPIRHAMAVLLLRDWRIFWSSGAHFANFYQCLDGWFEPLPVVWHIANSDEPRLVSTKISQGQSARIVADIHLFGSMDGFECS